MFEGLFNVFVDRLPDGWGGLLVDRLLKKQHQILNRVFLKCLPIGPDEGDKL